MSDPTDCVEIVTETMGFDADNDEQPSIAEHESEPSENDNKPIQMKTKEVFLEKLILNYAFESPSNVSADATDEEKQRDRERRLNAKTTRWRFIFSRCITRANSVSGKMAPGAQLWGATLFDLLLVKPIPDLDLRSSESSGSNLAAWMKANGEDYAKDMIDFTEHEDDPHLIVPYDITELIQNGDALVGEKSWIRDDQDEDKVVENGNGTTKERKNWQVPQPWPPASPFDPIAYPKPWPSKPFTKDFIGACYPKLQKYMIHSHLPQTLKVHDPWNVLPAVDKDWEDEKEEQWSDKTDVVHTYRLNTSTKHTARRVKDDEIAKVDEARIKTVYDTFIADPHSRNESPSGIIYLEDSDACQQPGPVKPPIFVVLPIQPPIPSTREAHLYLAPQGSIGEGNHSFVYSAEFELPRSTIMNDELCSICIMEDMRRILTEEDGPNGERRHPKWDEKVGRYVMKTVGKPARYVMKTAGKPTEAVLLGLEDDCDEEEYLIRQSTLRQTLEYEGPFRLIHSKVGHQCLERGPYCKHIAKSERGIHPLTAKVKVAAKLSIWGDPHLAREAETYQAFPRHFFQHWSGFNVIEPIKEPTPVGPIVPQFYGYYVPDRDSGESTSLRNYLSPILLLEDCGQELKPPKLTLDDQNEVAALVLRFHDAGWVHGSIAKRNILVQPGPLHDPPAARLVNSTARGGRGVDWSFRLIDFGRSRRTYELPKLIAEEGMSIRQLVEG